MKKIFDENPSTKREDKWIESFFLVIARNMFKSMDPYHMLLSVFSGLLVSPINFNQSKYTNFNRFSKK